MTKNELAKSKRHAWTAAGLCTCCGREPIPGKRRCVKCKEAYIKGNRAYHARLRDDCFTAYGGYVCACCGETERDFLTLDHENQDGAEHRRSLDMTRRGGWIIYLDLKKKGYPKGFQVLCMNCNWGRRKTGICPHKQHS